MLLIERQRAGASVVILALALICGFSGGCAAIAGAAIALTGAVAKRAVDAVPDLAVAAAILTSGCHSGT
jgi:hypothetical protein